MRSYQRGYTLELKAVKELREAGYIAVRTAGSRGPFDIIALGPSGVRLIQVKRVSRQSFVTLLKEAKKELEQVPSLYGVSREVWFWEAGKGWVVKELV